MHDTLMSYDLFNKGRVPVRLTDNDERGRTGTGAAVSAFFYV